MGASYSLQLAYPAELPSTSWTTPRLVASIDVPSSDGFNLLVVLKDGDVLVFMEESAEIVRLSPSGAHPPVALVCETEATIMSYHQETDTLYLSMFPETRAARLNNPNLMAKMKKMGFTEADWADYAVHNISTIFTPEEFQQAKTVGPPLPAPTEVRHGDRSVAFNYETDCVNRFVHLRQEGQPDQLFVPGRVEGIMELQSCHYFGGYLICSFFMDQGQPFANRVEIYLV